ncbi:MAG: hypothetical protein KDD48_06615 [Bdellovibrionales bacterium]|nr:hypothetical protein [Bdellovibrionales bacterium]
MKTKIPNWREKQQLLYAQKPNLSSLKAIFDSLLTHGAYEEALDYCKKLKDNDCTGKLRQISIEQGDFFLLEGLVKEGLTKAETQDWKNLANAAKSKGLDKFYHSAMAKIDSKE